MMRNTTHFRKQKFAFWVFESIFEHWSPAFSQKFDKVIYEFGFQNVECGILKILNLKYILLGIFGT